MQRRAEMRIFIKCAGKVGEQTCDAARQGMVQKSTQPCLRLVCFGDARKKRESRTITTPVVPRCSKLRCKFHSFIIRGMLAFTWLLSMSTSTPVTWSTSPVYPNETVMLAIPEGGDLPSGDVLLCTSAFNTPVRNRSSGAHCLLAPGGPLSPVLYNPMAC